MALTSRPYSSREDLREMQAIVSAAWSGAARPFIHCTPGDLEWWFCGGSPDADWPSRIRLWSLGSAPAGWGWLMPQGTLQWFVRHDLSDGDDAKVRDEILAWAEPTDLWAADGWREARHVLSRGWAAGSSALSQFLQPLNRPIPEPALPGGYRVRTMKGPGEIQRRVQVHREAFAPSRMTIDKYESLVTLDHYRYDQDVVVEAPDGTFAAFTLCWYDQAGAIGELEPVGTHPGHRKKGLARAANLHSLKILKALGASHALVFSDQSNEASEALYRSAGFSQIATHRKYARTQTG